MKKKGGFRKEKEKRVQKKNSYEWDNQNKAYETENTYNNEIDQPYETENTNNNEIDQPYAPYDAFASVCVVIDYDGFNHQKCVMFKLSQCLKFHINLPDY